MISLAALLRRIAVVSNALPLLPGQLPTFGNGRVQLFYDNGTFVVPAGVTQIRVRVIGGGAGKTENGGSTSFGALLSATGGLIGSGTTGGAGGTGTGGDFQASGGAGGDGGAYSTSGGGGGGAAGSPMGNGGNGGVGGNGSGGGGGGVGGGHGSAGGFTIQALGHGGAPGRPATTAHPGRDLFGLRPKAGVYNNGSLNAGGGDLPFPFFAFVGGGGRRDPNGAGGGIGGPGAGGAGYSNGFGGVGGGGGGGYAVGFGAFGGVVWPAVADTTHAVNAVNPFDGYDYTRIGGGCGGDGNEAGNGKGGGGGGGYAHGVFSVTPGQSFAVTVAAQGTFSSGGLVIVEW